jgi:hypothetical protein
MISRIRCGRAGLLILAAGIGMAPVLRAGAQTVPVAEDQEAPTAEAAAAPDAEDADINGLELDWSQLNVDAATLATRPISRSPQAAAGSDTSWSSKSNANGSAGVSVKQPLSPFWDTRIGADMTVARQPSTMSELLAEKVANGGNAPQSSGSAWAAVTAPGAGAIWDKTAVEARVDPGQEQSKLGTSISKSVPLKDDYSLTLQNGYNMTQQGLVPVPGLAARTTRNYETDQSAKLSVGDTGTSVTAGQTLSSSDDKWLRKIGAEQKLLDGVTVSGSVGETAQGATNKSVTAGFKRSW